MKLNDMITHTFLDIHPKEFQFTEDKIDIIQFRNALHYKNTMLAMQINRKCPYKSSVKNGVFDAQKRLKQNKSTYDGAEFEAIKNNIKNALHKRGLISDTVYESYEYDVEGEIVDVSKVIEGNPECMLRPAKSYTNYFYELYISLSIPWSVDDKDIQDSIYKVVATLQLLEQERIYVKVNMVIPTHSVAPHKNFMMIAPLFSHKDAKDPESMMAYINRDALRCMYFLMVENMYGEDLDEGYGQAMKMPGVTITCYNIDPEELASDIINKVIVGEE